MKKLIAFALALMMALSLAACGSSGGNDPKPSGSEDGTPSASQQVGRDTPDPGTDEPDNSGGEEQTAVEWPTADYISEKMKYTGTGSLIHHFETTWAGDTYTKVCIADSSLEDVGNYIAFLKANGIEYLDVTTMKSENEPELAFSDTGLFTWWGLSSDGYFMKLELYEKTQTTFVSGVDDEQEYNLELKLYKESKFLD